MRLLLIDTSAIFWTSWHATAGEDIASAFTRTVTRCHELRAGFDLVACCTDEGRCFRYDILPTYKANRPPRDAIAVEHLRKVKARLRADGFHVVGSDGFEGDDVIATLARWGVANGHEVTIAGCDKDLYQLVGPGVVVRNTMTGAIVDEAGVLEKTGVRPDQIRDWLALMGDTSDNVPGVPGVGPKTAAKLVTEHGSVDALYVAIADGKTVATEKGQAALVAAGGAVALAYRLVTLRTDVPVNGDELLTPIAPTTLTDSEEEPVPEDDDLTTPESAPAPVADVPSAPASPAAIVVAQAAETPHVSREVIARTDPRFATALEPTNMSQAMWLAKKLVDSRLFSAYGTPEAVLAIILTGRSMGVDAMTSIRGFHMVKGRPTMSAAMMVGLVLASGKCEYFDLVESTPEKAVYETKRIGSRRAVTMTFTIEDARRAKLIEPGGNWEKIPRTMLRHRCETELARAVYPDVVQNVYSQDEVTGEPAEGSAS